ncbi:type IV pilus assembly protein FimV [Arsukibacterium indicum]|uniref:FimV N-terminal domain-containing protein n=1 Tax=Arsukibacterium indicum TaxID=2848612 RepID=A0ABS6MKE6_9GAMM|nr:FimV/HubP family polar landmark protein [Arsukibacterium indicum]MBV2129283.1 hypothetical protein [Arsukibacterium indicum]
MKTLLHQLLQRTVLPVLLLTAMTISAAGLAAELGPVTKTDTLWRLAVQARPDDAVSMPQVIYALWQANPAAFVDGDINKLRAGTVLQVPSRSKMLANDAAVARVWFYQAIRGQVATAVSPAKTDAAKVAVKPAAQATAKPAPATTPVAGPADTAAPASVAAQPAAPQEQQADVDTSSPAPGVGPAAGFSLRQQHQLTAQQRYFAETGAVGQARAHTLLSLLSDWSWQDEDGVHSFQFTPFLRWHQRDSASNLLDLRQAYWRYAGRNWEVKAGNDIIFWGVSESQRLVDVINQVDMVGGVDMETRLGQPMLSFKGWNSAGTLELYLLPYFRERLFADPAGRLTTPWPVEHDIAIYESTDERNNLDVALRWSQRFSSLDLGLSYFAGNSREPLLILQPVTQRLQPYYFQMQQLGLDTQYVAGDWLWKLETIYRRSGPQEFAAATAGFEYTRVGVFNQSWDLGWIAEYQYDSRGLQAPVTGQNDMFIGWRLALNDIAGSEVLFGVLQDLDRSSSRSARLEASMRLTNSLRLRLNAWLFQTDDIGDVLYNLRQDDYLELSLDYYF